MGPEPFKQRALQSLAPGGGAELRAWRREEDQSAGRAEPGGLRWAGQANTRSRRLKAKKFGF